MQNTSVVPIPSPAGPFHNAIYTISARAPAMQLQYHKDVIALVLCIINSTMLLRSPQKQSDSHAPAWGTSTTEQNIRPNNSLECIHTYLWLDGFVARQRLLTLRWCSRIPLPLEPAVAWPWSAPGARGNHCDSWDDYEVALRTRYREVGVAWICRVPRSWCVRSFPCSVFQLSSEGPNAASHDITWHHGRRQSVCM